MQIRPVGSTIAVALLVLGLLFAPWLPADVVNPPGTLFALKGHRETVYGVAFSPDGKYLVSASGEPTIKVWHLASGKELKTFAGPAGHKGLITALAVSPDGTQFATASSDNTARVWDFPAARHLREFTHGSDPRAVAVSPDGNRLALGGQDGLIRLWNKLDDKPLELVGHSGAITGLRFSANGQTLVSVGTDSTLRTWNANEGKLLATVAAHSEAVSALELSASGNAIYTAGPEGTVRFWASPLPVPKALPPLKTAISALALSSDGSLLAAASDKSLRLASSNSGQVSREFTDAPEPIQTLAVGSGLVAAGAGRELLVWQSKESSKMLWRQTGHAEAVTAVAFHPSTGQLVSVGKDGLLRLWNLPAQRAVALPSPGSSVATTLSQDGKRLAIATADKTLRLYQKDNFKTPERQLTGLTAATRALALSSDGKIVVAGDEQGQIRLWNASRDEPIGSIGGHVGAVTSLSFLASDRFLSSGADGAVKLWQIPTAVGKAALPHAGAVTGMALSADGKQLFTACADKQVRAWNLKTGQPERTWTGPTQALTALALSPTGDKLAVGSADNSVHVWPSNSSKLLGKLEKLPAAVTALTFTSDGKLLAGLADGTVRLHEATGGKELRVFEGHKGAISYIVQLPSGTQFLTAGADGLVQVRPLAGGAATASWKHPVGVSAVAVLRDGTRLAVGSADKGITIYELPTGKPLSRFTTPAEVRGLAWSADGKRLAVAGSDSQARLYTVTGVLEEFVPQEGPCRTVALSADGRQLYLGGDKGVQVSPLWLAWQERHEGPARQVLPSPRGDRILSAGDDGTVRLWAMQDTKLSQSLRAHTGGVVALGVSADASRLVTVGKDKTLRLWDIAKLPTGQTPGKDLSSPLLSIALPGEPISLALSPNGQRIAVGLLVAGKEQVRLHDGQTGKEWQVLEETVPARSLTWLADNRTLLASGATAQLVDCNLQTAWPAHEGGVVGLAIASSGNQFATIGLDRTLKLWKPTGELERSLPLAGIPSALAYSRDNAQIAVTLDKRLIVFGVADGKEVLSLDMPAAATAIAFSADRVRLLTGHADGRARVWDVATRSKIQGVLHTGPVRAALFHPTAANQFFTAGQDGSVVLHTLAISRVVPTGSPVRGLAATANSTHVVAACADGKTRILNAGNGSVERTLEGGDKEQTCVAVSRNNLLVAVGSADSKVRLFGYGDGKLLSQFTAPSIPRSLGFVGTGQALLAIGRDGAVTAWDTQLTAGQPPPAEFGKVLQTYQHAGEGFDLSVPSTGNLFYTAAADRSVKSWKLASDAPVRTFNHPQSVNALTYNKDGTLLATGAGDGRIRLFDLSKGNQIREIVAHNTMNRTAIYALAFSPDGKTLLSGSVDHSLKLHNVADGKLIREFKAYKEKEFDRGHQEAVLAVAFSPDGSLIASAGMDRSIKVWNLATGTVLRDLVNPAYKAGGPGQPMPAHPGWIYALRFAEGGKTLLSVGGAPRLRGYLASWDVAGGKLLAGREVEVGIIYSLAVSPDEKILAIGTGGSIRSPGDPNQILVLSLPVK